MSLGEQNQQVGLFGDTKNNYYIKIMKIKIKYYIPIINWPDKQWRLYKNTPEIKWDGKVHERLVGFNKYTSLPETVEFALFHHKTIDRQEKQNEFYNKI
jgi:hypothetical protein